MQSSVLQGCSQEGGGSWLWLVLLQPPLLKRAALIVGLGRTDCETPVCPSVLPQLLWRRAVAGHLLSVLQEQQLVISTIHSAASCNNKTAV